MQVNVSEVAEMGTTVEMVDTAIPVFIGYTEKAVDRDGSSLTKVPKRIASLQEYKQSFGGAYLETLYVDVTQPAAANLAARFVNPPAGTTPAPTLRAPFFLPSFLLHYSIALFYANGGEACYILSVGPYSFRNGAPEISSAALKDAFPLLEAYVGPTLIVIPDACRLSLTAVSTDIQTVADIANASLAHCSKMQDRFAIIDVPISEAAIASGAASSVLDADIAFRSHLIDDVEQLKYGAAYYPYMQTDMPYASSPDNVHITSTLYNGTLTGAQASRTDVYDVVNRLVGGTQALLPPGGGVAGCYARVDNTLGVWKAPANVGIFDVVTPTINVNDDFQGALSMDLNGKSINAIRTFIGRGTLIWGARTLAGNDTDFRYVPARRFLICVEQSIKQAMAQFVFEPNDANTWAKVRGMIDKFLSGRWASGALQGQKPEDAFFVRVGLGATMTAQDLLDGKLIVVIGLATVRPAEFVILNITQLMHKP
jgi:phage tail sheath protein FI